MGARDEAAKWGLEVDRILRKYQDDSRNALNALAARGHLGISGHTQDMIVNLGQEVKRELTKANAKIYGEGLKQLAQRDEVEQKVAVGLAKLDLEKYKAQLENALALERAEAELDIDARQAELAIMKSEVEKRQAAIIEEKARIEAEVNYWKKLQVEAEGLSLEAEIALINEKVKTAEAQLPIIAELHKLIDAEYLLVAAEERRAAILPLVIEAEKKLAEVREAMIPLQVEKADARIDQAAAITQEAEVKKEIAELGYRRIELKDAQEDADHQIRLAENERDVAYRKYIEAQNLTELTKQQIKTILDELDEDAKHQLRIQEIENNQLREDTIRAQAATELARAEGRTTEIRASTEADHQIRQAELLNTEYHQDYLRTSVLTELLKIKGRTQAMKDEEAAQHELRMMEITRDQAHLEYVRADAAVTLAKSQAKTTLDEYDAMIRKTLVEMKKALEMDEKGYKLGLKWFWTNFELLHEIIATELERTLFSQELSSKLNSMLEEARDDCMTVRDSAWQKHENFSAHRQWRYITKG